MIRYHKSWLHVSCNPTVEVHRMSVCCLEAAVVLSSSSQFAVHIENIGVSPVSLSAFTGVPPNRSATINSKCISGTCHSLTSSCDTSFWQWTSVCETPGWWFGFRTSQCTCSGPVLLSLDRRIRRGPCGAGFAGENPCERFF